VQLISNRDYRTIAVIKSSSWEDLGLEEPQLTVEEKAEGIGMPVEDYRKIAMLTEQFRQLKEKKLEEQPEVEAEENVEEDVAVTENQPIKPPETTLISWNCVACTYRNTSSHRMCEICATPRATAARKPNQDSKGEDEPVAAAEGTQASSQEEEKKADEEEKKEEENKP